MGLSGREECRAFVDRWFYGESRSVLSRDLFSLAVVVTGYA